MAEYCNKCTPTKQRPDYYLFWIALFMPKDTEEAILCEGCNVRAICKDEKGKIYLVKNKKINKTNLLKLFFWLY